MINEYLTIYAVKKNRFAKERDRSMQEDTKTSPLKQQLIFLCLILFLALPREMVFTKSQPQNILAKYHNDNRIKIFEN